MKEYIERKKVGQCVSKEKKRKSVKQRKGDGRKEFKERGKKGGTDCRQR